MFKSFQVRSLATAIKKRASKTVIGAKARKIKDLNYENKVLFGAVNKNATTSTAAKSTINDHSELASEMFWQLQIKNAPHIRSTTSKLSVEQRPSVPDMQIPFKDSELRSLLTFPFVPSASGTLERTWMRHEQNENALCKSPSVSKILNATMSDAARQALLKWKATKIALLGEDGFAELQKATLERGSNFHSCLERWLAEEPVDDDRLKKAIELWNSVSNTLDRVGRPAEVIERKIYHPFLHYKGVVDCVSSLDNKLHIIEWKTSEKQKPTLSATYDAPIQLCAYLGAMQANPDFAALVIPSGAVFVAYTDGSPAHVHILNQAKLKKYWTVWLQRLQEYWVRYRDNTLPEPI